MQWLTSGVEIMELLIGDTIGFNIHTSDMAIHTRLHMGKSFMWEVIRKKLFDMRGIRTVTVFKYTCYVSCAELYTIEELLPEIRKVVVRYAPRTERL